MQNLTRKIKKARWSVMESVTSCVSTYVGNQIWLGDRMLISRQVHHKIKTPIADQLRKLVWRHARVSLWRNIIGYEKLN